MKTVWKCDFCIYINDDSNITSDHEKKCSFNPATKRCQTCHNKIYGEWETALEITYCKNEYVDHDHMLEVQDGEIKCQYWELEH